MTDIPDIEFHRQLIKTGQLPTFLYKYTRLSDKFLTTLCDSELSFSNPTTFNDPFDCQINDQTQWTNETIQEYINTNKKYFSELALKLAVTMPPHLFGDFIKKVLAETISEIGVTCFSKSSTNLLLWSHYAASHTGVCLKFDILKDSRFFHWTFPVKYSDNYPVYDFLINRNAITEKVILTKSNHWSYEEEIRTLKKTSDPHKFDKSCLIEIIFGCKTTQPEIDSTIKRLTLSGFNHVVFKKAVLKTTQFDIEFVDI